MPGWECEQITRGSWDRDFVSPVMARFATAMGLADSSTYNLHCHCHALRGRICHHSLGWFVRHQPLRRLRSLVFLVLGRYLDQFRPHIQGRLRKVREKLGGDCANLHSGLVSIDLISILPGRGRRQCPVQACHVHVPCM
jgi:hypothetical protein